MLRELKFEKGFFGGNMEALEATRFGYQILISDCFGNVPEPGDDWSMSIYKKDSLGEYSDTPEFTFEGKTFGLKKVELFARKKLNKIIASRSKHAVRQKRNCKKGRKSTRTSK